MTVSDTPPSDLSSQLDNLLSSLPSEESVQSSAQSTREPLPTSLSSIIDHTLLAPNSTIADIQRIVREAVELQTCTFCINASMLPYAIEELDQHKETKVKPIVVVAFPFGSSTTESKKQETSDAVRLGAKEIDMVQNVGLLRSKQYDLCWKDVNAVVKAAGQDVPVKVIIETAYLTWQQVAISTYIACSAGASFVKTSTGYASSGAQPEHIALMSHIAKPFNVQVKASGGIRSLAKVKEMWDMGATRVGASGTRAILDEYKNGSASQEQQSGGY
ncbi:unnamed protein product [Sympodiomycopsis kandeliae]